MNKTRFIIYRPWFWQVPESYFPQIELSKEKVKNMLLDSTSDLVDKVSLIDELCQLGVSYHFESEIDDQLKPIYDRQHDLLTGNDYNLYTTALLFRVFRQHGFRISCGRCFIHIFKLRK